MDQVSCCPVCDTGLSPSSFHENPESTPLWHRCAACDDWGISCRGFDITALGDIEEVRACHRFIRKAKKIVIKVIADYAKRKISESTVNEYFGSEKKDYKFTTVITIHEGMLYACSKRAGVPVPTHSCPSSSSEARQQLAAADLKLAAAELKTAQVEADAAVLREKLTEVKGRHIAQLSQIEANHARDMEWMKDDIRLWRRFSFLLLGVGLILLIMLVFYIGWDVTHPSSGLIQY